MFTFSKNKENTFITGTIFGEVFGINYNKDTFEQMEALEVKLLACTKGVEAREITEEFKLLTVENPASKKVSEIHKDIHVSNEGKFYLKVGDKITSVAMPEELVDRIKDTLDKGLSIEPVIKFWIRFLRNHKLRNICKTTEEKEAFAKRLFRYVNADYINYSSVSELVEKKGYTIEVAEQMCTVKQVQITMEGLLKTYKVSKEITKRYRLNEKGEKESYDVYEAKVTGVDPITGIMQYADKAILDNEDRVFKPTVMGDGGDAFFCGDVKGHIIKVGQTHRLESWNQINTNDDSACVKGLHCGGLTYIKGYQDSNTETHNTLVCPSKIGAVTDDGSGAIRVMEYFTLDAFSGNNGSLYHSSTYGAQLDAAWESEKAEILKEFGELQAKKQDSLDEMKAI